MENLENNMEKKNTLKKRVNPSSSRPYLVSVDEERGAAKHTPSPPPKESPKPLLQWSKDHHLATKQPHPLKQRHEIHCPKPKSTPKAARNPGNHVETGRNQSRTSPPLHWSRRFRRPLNGRSDLRDWAWLVSSIYLRLRKFPGDGPKGVRSTW